MVLLKLLSLSIRVNVNDTGYSVGRINSVFIRSEKIILRVTKFENTLSSPEKVMEFRKVILGRRHVMQSVCTALFCVAQILISHQ